MQLIEIESPEQWELLVNKLKSISDNVDWQTEEYGYEIRGWWAGATDEAEEGTWVWTQSGKSVENFTRLPVPSFSLACIRVHNSNPEHVLHI